MRSPRSRILGLTLLLGLAAGCGRKEPGDAEGQRIQPGAQPVASAEWGYLPLKMGRTHERRKPLEKPPWHEAGGDWTFLECELAKDASAKILIGVTIRAEPTGEIPVAWGEGVLAVADAEAGARFVAAFAEAFHEAVPPSHGHKPAGRLKANTAVLGSKLARDPQGGFRAGSGRWTATKWFLEDESGEAEVFFNFSTADGLAEFSEKDEEYRAPLVEQLVIGLRDGPWPERTPENDPNLTLVGPRAIGWTRIADARAASQFTPDSQGVLISERGTNGGTRLFLASVSEPAQRRLLAEFEGVASVHEFVTNRQELTLLILETLPQNRKMISSSDPQRLWLTTTDGARPVAVPTGLTNWYASQGCVSPDARYLALHEWKHRSKTRQTRVIHLGDLVSGQWRVIEMPDTVLALLGWKHGHGVVSTGTAYDKEEARRGYELDPATGQLTALDEPPDAVAAGNLPSPDGRWTVRVEEKRRLVIRETASGQAREFVFHPNDQRHAHGGSVTWANGTYLVFQGACTALINAETLKMNFPTARESGFAVLEFSTDFQRVLGRTEDGQYVGRMASADTDERTQ